MSRPATDDSWSRPTSWCGERPLSCGPRGTPEPSTPWNILRTTGPCTRRCTCIDYTRQLGCFQK
eukprot:3099482-Pleurochrysis_carterae.AAC.1